MAIFSGKGVSSDSTTTGSESSLGRTTSHAIAARNALSGSIHTLVIDDFHYVPQDVQLAIVRGLKDLVFDGLGVVFASVPIGPLMPCGSRRK